MPKRIAQARQVRCGQRVTVTITAIGSDELPGRISVYGEEGEELRLWPESVVRIEDSEGEQNGTI
jgi:hypothetical protein